jgi:hypothetical protein
MTEIGKFWTLFLRQSPNKEPIMSEKPSSGQGLRNKPKYMKIYRLHNCSIMRGRAYTNGSVA